MQILKSAILTLLLVITALFGFMVFKFDTKYALKLTEKEYEQKNYESALATLQKIKKKSAKVDLYKGYALRGLDQYKAAQNAFETAYKKAETKDIKNEASFNLLHTAYLQSDYPFIRSHLAQISHHLPFAQFFSALCEYQSKNYEKAYFHFNQAQKPQYYSSWMKELWQDEFPKLWEISHRAHCLIEMGQIDESRKLLEKHLEDQDAAGYTAYLLALGYLKEIPQKRTLEEALNAFELASLHANRLSKESFSKLFNFQRFTDYSLPIWSLIVDKGSLENFDRWVHVQLHVDYFTAAHQTKILKSLEPKINNLSPSIFFSKASKLISLPWSKSHLSLLEKMHSHFITELIEEENFEALHVHLPTIQRLLSWDQEQKNTMTHLVLDKLNTLSQEENTFSEMYDLLLLWDSIERDKAGRLVFIEQILPLIKQLWPTDPKMALQLAKWTDQFSHPDQKEFMHHSMLEFLQDPMVHRHPEEVLEANQYFNPLYPH